MWFHKTWQGAFPEVNLDLPKGEVRERDFLFIVGPCALESKQQVEKLMEVLKPLKLCLFRACLFKPRTDPKAFQGLGEKGIELLKLLRKEGFILEGEILHPDHVALLEPYLDIFRIGSRNAQNFALLQALGEMRKPVILKRGMGMTVDEWLFAAEYIAQKGNDQIILCERGIRTFEVRTRHTLDLAGALLAQEISGLPVIIDPSHGVGVPSLVPPLCQAVAATPLRGVMVEVHPFPDKALSDGFQALPLEALSSLVQQVQGMLSLKDRRIYGTS